MGVELAIGAAIAAAATAANMYQGKRQNDRAEAAESRQREAMEKAEQQQEQDFNRANRKQADVGALLQQNTGGYGGANLTGGYAGTGTLGGGGMLGR